MNEIHNIRVSLSTIRAAYHELQFKLREISRKYDTKDDNYWKAYELESECAAQEELFERFMTEPLISCVDEFIRENK